MDLDDYITVREAASLRGLQYKTLLARIRNGAVPAKIIHSRIYMIDREHLSQIEGSSNRDGRRSHPLYSTYMNMLRRCYNPNSHHYNRYGGRGIRVCKKWREDFWSFVKDMGEKPTLNHSIDRKNNDGNYTRGNCKWSTKVEQANNRNRERSA